MTAPRRTIKIRVEQADALVFKADVLALKYAQAHYGVDRAVAQRLRLVRSDIDQVMPLVDFFETIDTRGILGAPTILFLGVKPLWDFDYAEIRQFGRRALMCLGVSMPRTRHVAITLHGPGFGLDEAEAFKAEVAGLIEAINGGEFPHCLSQITIVEIDAGCAQRLQQELGRLIPTGEIIAEPNEAFTALSASMGSVGYDSATKPFIFVAMPFDEKMRDVFHYGIKNAARAAGFLCERVDETHFTGDVLDRIKNRIKASAAVVADLSASSPNVYLEVGYAWGCRKPTILITQNAAELRFDVQGQRCLDYKGHIQVLEHMLREELVGLNVTAQA